MRLGSGPLSEKTRETEMRGKRTVRDIVSSYGNLVVERERKKAREQRNVTRAMYQISQADPTNIVSVRQGNCRFCWGDNFEYQRADWELDRDLNRFLAANKKGHTFNPMGGGGWVKTRDPNPKCPNCLGEGESYVRIEDFRKLSTRDKALIAGIKIGKNGQVEEVKFHDKINAVNVYAKLEGMIIEKKLVKVLEATEEDLDQYFAANPVTIDANDPALASFTKQIEAQAEPAVTETEWVEVTQPVTETRGERIRRLKAQGVVR